jgi:GGDEF domain-containing protein
MRRGDQILRRFADALRESFRPDDSFIRYGGDEFLVVAPRLERRLAEDRVESLRRRIADSAGDGPSLNFSVASPNSPRAAVQKTPCAPPTNSCTRPRPRARREAKVKEN